PRARHSGGADQPQPARRLRRHRPDRRPPPRRRRRRLRDGAHDAGRGRRDDHGRGGARATGAVVTASEAGAEVGRGADAESLRERLSPRRLLLESNSWILLILLVMVAAFSITAP